MWALYLPRVSRKWGTMSAAWTSIPRWLKNSGPGRCISSSPVWKNWSPATMPKDGSVSPRRSKTVSVTPCSCSSVWEPRPKRTVRPIFPMSIRWPPPWGRRCRGTRSWWTNPRFPWVRPTRCAASSPRNWKNAGSPLSSTWSPTPNSSRKGTPSTIS